MGRGGGCGESKTRGSELRIENSEFRIKKGEGVEIQN